MTYRLSEPVPSKPIPAVTVVNPLPGRRQSAKPAGNGWALFGYNLLIFLTSVCVMTLELTASRIVGKHLGASIYTWTSVIGVILAGITLGNWLGGWLADRVERHRALGWMYLFSSVFSAGVLLFEKALGHLSRPEGLSWPVWVLAMVGMLFLLPAVTLGATSPLIASLALSRSNRLGATVGNVYAWGACGSIVGTFLTGFYLIDLFGSRAIIGLIAATLAVLAVITVGRRGMFRALVIFGWMQFFLMIWAVSTATQASWSVAAETLLDSVRRFCSDDARAVLLTLSETIGKSGQKLHELGLVLAFRDDPLGQYQDESQYSYINVHDSQHHGERIKVLRLDKLVHSYYNPAHPTKLHYEYEKVYAAVTKLSAGRLTGDVSVTAPEFADWNAFRQRLPAGVSYDEASRRLSCASLDRRTLDALRRIAPESDYWNAVEDLARLTRQSDWGGAGSVPLDRLPEGVTLPADLASVVQYDAGLKRLIAYRPIEPEDRDRLIQLAPHAVWLDAIHRLQAESGKIRALCIGGGGYIFPRWLLEEFPGSERIDVAELDPAVRDAVVAQLGLTSRDESRITTLLGDARQTVDDLLRQNARRQDPNAAPLLYDYIYGDAFNDFSVPWHLTTLEFQQKLKDLLAPGGMVQVNLIDALPRSELSDHPLNDRDVPEAFSLRGVAPGYWSSAGESCPSLEFQPLADQQILLGYRGVMSPAVKQQLLEAAPENSAWTAAVSQLHQRTLKPSSGQFLGRYVYTASQVFPNLYLFSSSPVNATALRDTFVLVCTLEPLDLRRLPESEYWTELPFAVLETPSPDGPRQSFGQMDAVIGLAHGQRLTDDFAPVDNLLLPVFADR